MSSVGDTVQEPVESPESGPLPGIARTSVEAQLDVRHLPKVVLQQTSCNLSPGCITQRVAKSYSGQGIAETQKTLMFGL